MTARFSVIRYLPDPSNGECINIGVLVFNGERVWSRFLGDWKRVRSFGGDDIDGLREFAKEVQRQTGLNQLSAELDARTVLDQALIEQLSHRWIHSIQISEPMGALLPPDALLDSVARQYLSQPVAGRARTRDRRFAAALAERELRGAIQLRLGKELAGQLVQAKLILPGHWQSHQFDVGVKNGNVYAAATAVSFETRSSDDRENQIKAVEFDVFDVRQQLPDLPLAVVALPPKTPLARYERFVYDLSRANVRVVGESDVQQWAKDVAATLPEGGLVSAE